MCNRMTLYIAEDTPPRSVKRPESQAPGSPRSGAHGARGSQRPMAAAPGESPAGRRRRRHGCAGPGGRRRAGELDMEGSLRSRGEAPAAPARPQPEGAPRTQAGGEPALGTQGPAAPLCCTEREPALSFRSPAYSSSRRSAVQKTPRDCVQVHR